MSLPRQRRESPADRRVGRLLVVTGYRPSEIAFQLSLVADLAESGRQEGVTHIVLKAHPMSPIPQALVQRLRRAVGEDVSVSAEPLEHLWQDVTSVFAANSTSAIIEAIYRGLPAAVCASDDEMNLSPALGYRGIPVIGDVEALQRFLASPPHPDLPEDYFVIDPALPRWRALLEPYSAAGAA
jgi:surface carbohydrate biosynthesis protein (TIGR04326 family)